MIGVIKGTMRQKKEVNGLPLPIASYKAHLKAPIRRLKVAITAKQSGSGTPSPDNIRPIIGVSECNVVRCGTNVWDEEWELGYWDASDGRAINVNTEIRGKNFIPVEPNLSYRFVKTSTLGSIIYFNKAKQNIGYVNVGNNMGRSFTTPSDCYFIKINFGGNYGTTYNNDSCINYPSTDTDYHAYTGNTYTIQLGDTYYGGELDVTNGVLTVTNVSVDMGSLEWSRKHTSTTYYYFVATPEPFKADNFNFISSVYDNVQQIRTRLNDKEMGLFNISSTETYRQIVARDDDYETAETFIASVTGQQIVYELATPITVQLTPTQVEQLLGTNNVFADCGDVEELIYTDRQVYYGR